MPATATASTLSRCIAWLLGKSSTSISEGLVEETEELGIPTPTTLQDDSYLYRPQAFNARAALPQHSPLDILELSLLCTAQGIAVVPEEAQTAVLRTAVAAATKVTVAEFVEPIPMEVEILLPTPTMSLTPPTPTKRKPKADSRSFTPLENFASAPGTLRPSGRWHGRKRTSNRRAHDKENLAPATASLPLKTREERLKAYTPPACLLGLRQGQESTSRYPTSHRF
ncbi:hypothetical protein CPB85DRAFT_1436475 [Mucidula mucida]|nr:hypothetical protein CPB85DRAFT_1436475 [Mucidula mucida]